MKFLFIESICNDPAALQQNYLNKMLYSPDYTGVDMTQARGSGGGGGGGAEGGRGFRVFGLAHL